MASRPGLFFTGTDTGVGKTYVAALVARQLGAEGRGVGVYKPVASGCNLRAGALVSDDAEALWEAAGKPADLEDVCPQRFAAPLAPHLAAHAEGKRVDPELLREGLQFWTQRSEIVLVEGVGGLMSPMSDDDYVADLAEEFGLPLVVVSRNVLGTINQTLQTLITAACYGLPVAGIVLNQPLRPPTDDVSLTSNRAELATRAVPPLLAEVPFAATQFDREVDWFKLAAG
ncbi:MAG: dethiobiotin synthase [Planctomycetota bacterium]